jgi:hypothetical protein
VLSRISAAKNNLYSWKEYQENSELINDDKIAGKPLLGTLYEHYQKRLFKSGAMAVVLRARFSTRVILRLPVRWSLWFRKGMRGPGLIDTARPSPERTEASLYEALHQETTERSAGMISNPMLTSMQTT